MGYSQYSISQEVIVWNLSATTNTNLKLACLHFMDAHLRLLLVV